MEQNENRVENRRMELLEIEMKTQRKARKRELAAQITLLFFFLLDWSVGFGLFFAKRIKGYIKRYFFARQCIALYTLSKKYLFYSCFWSGARWLKMGDGRWLKMGQDGESDVARSVPNTTSHFIVSLIVTLYNCISPKIFHLFSWKLLTLSPFLRVLQKKKAHRWAFYRE